MEQPAGGDAHRLGSDDHRGRVTEQPRAKPLAEPRRRASLVRARQLPRCEIEKRHDEGQAGDQGDRTADRVIDGAGSTASIRPPGGPDGRTREQERIYGQHRRAQEPRRRQEAATDDGQPIEALRRVVQVRPEEQGEGLPAHGCTVECSEQAVEVDRRQRCAIGLL